MESYRKKADNKGMAGGKLKGKVREKGQMEKGEGKEAIMLKKTEREKQSR